MANFGPTFVSPILDKNPSVFRMDFNFLIVKMNTPTQLIGQLKFEVYVKLFAYEWMDTD